MYYSLVQQVCTKCLLCLQLTLKSCPLSTYKMHEDLLAQCDNSNTLGIITAPHNIVKLCLAFLILLANTILISVILKSKKFRSQRFHMFIISLALADILVGLIIPFMVITAKENTWALGVTFCQVICWLGSTNSAVIEYVRGLSSYSV